MRCQHVFPHREFFCPILLHSGCLQSHNKDPVLSWSKVYFRHWLKLGNVDFSLWINPIMKKGFHNWMIYILLQSQVSAGFENIVLVSKNRWKSDVDQPINMENKWLERVILLGADALGLRIILGEAKYEMPQVSRCSIIIIMIDINLIT